jgi:hypothetical protein
MAQRTKQETDTLSLSPLYHLHLSSGNQPHGAERDVTEVKGVSVELMEG